MKKYSKMILSMIVLAGMTQFASLTAHAQENPALDREAVEKIIREYLISNPEILFEVQQAFEEKQQQEIAAQQKEILQAAQSTIYDAPYQIEIGDENAEVTVVEFFDYNCGFCQRALSDMQALLAENKNVRFVLKEFPVLGEASVEASRISMAFSKIMPEKHAEFHIDLLEMPGQKDGARALALAVEFGADEAKIREEMENPQLMATIQETYQLATNLGINGTPSYIIGDQVVPGAVGIDELRKSIQGAE